MDGQVRYEDNSTNCLNISENVLKEFQALRIFGIIGIPLLLVPTLILQLFFIYRYKSTFLHRQFLYATIVVVLMNAIYIVYPSTVHAGCPLFYLFVNSLNRYTWYVEMMQMTTIHLLLLYKLCKHMETRIMQRLQVCCCDIRSRLWHDVMIVCIQFGLPLPILIAEIVMTLKIKIFNMYLIKLEMNCFIRPLLSVNILLGLTCTVILVSWFCMLWKRRLLKSKVKFVCTQMGHILFILAVYIIWNIMYIFLEFEYGLVVLSVIRTVAPVSFGVYVLMSIPNLQRKVTTKAQVFATNRLHTNPPSTRVSLPTDTAEHVPNFLSPTSTSEPSEVTPLVNNETLL